MDIEKEREAFEKSYAEMLIGGELKGLESVIFSKYLESGEYAQDKVDTAWCMWQAAKAQAVPEGFVLAPEECSDDMACKIAAIARVCGGIAGDIYEAVVNQAMIEAQEQNQ